MADSRRIIRTSGASKSNVSSRRVPGVPPAKPIGRAAKPISRISKPIQDDVDKSREPQDEVVKNEPLLDNPDELLAPPAPDLPIYEGGSDPLEDEEGEAEEKPSARKVAKPSGRSGAPAKPAARTSARMQEQEADEDAEVPPKKVTPEKSTTGSRTNLKPGSRRTEAQRDAEEPAAKSTASRTRMAAVSRRGVRAEAEGVDARRSRRSNSASRPIPKKYVILGSLGVILILGAIIAYKPVMRSMYMKALNDPAASAESRAAAAENLYASFRSDALAVFSQGLLSSDAGLRNASASGMVKFAKDRKLNVENRIDAIDRIGEAIGKSDQEGKMLFIGMLSATATPDDESKNAAESDAACNAEIVKFLVPLTEPSEAVLQARTEAVGALCKLRAPGACKQLLKIATAEKGDLRNIARGGLVETALPDAVGALLTAMSGSDTELARDASRAFARVRDQSSSDDLLKLVDNPNENVRREIVDALGKRGADAKATEGVTRALSDASPEIRVIALKSVPKTNVKGPISQLGKLATDPEENVRIACAEALGKLRDPDSLKVLIEAFQNDFQGKTLDAFAAALGNRRPGKDLKAIGILMDLLQKKAESGAALKQALILLTSGSGGKQRESARQGWDVERWKTWYARITEREEKRVTALAALKKLNGKRGDDRSQYSEFYKQTVAALDELELCKKMCSPDDSEDVGGIDGEIGFYTSLQETFLKGASVDLRR